MMPFAIQRPYAKQLPDGRVFVTGRHVNGGLGTFGWCGDLKKEAGTYAIGGPRRKYAAELTSEALVIKNKSEHECRYSLLPPENCHSEVLFEAEMKVEGPPDEGIAFLSVSSLMGMVLHIGPNFVSVNGSSRPDLYHADNFTSYRNIKIVHRRGLLQTKVDGKTIINQAIFRGETGAIDSRGGQPELRTQFGQLGDEGKSFWKRVSFEGKNPRLEDWSWSCSASSNEWPDQYQRNRMIQIHPNHPHPGPDHGYSSWLPLQDGRILLVDYTNLGDEPGKGHLVGVYIDPQDIE